MRHTAYDALCRTSLSLDCFAIFQARNLCGHSWRTCFFLTSFMSGSGMSIVLSYSAMASENAWRSTDAACQSKSVSTSQPLARRGKAADEKG